MSTDKLQCQSMMVIIINTPQSQSRQVFIHYLMLLFSSSVRIRSIATVVGFAMCISLSSTCFAQTENANKSEAELRAAAQKTLKGKVEPFVNKYCASCHGSRPEAGINLKAALKHPGSASSFLHWKKAVANVKVHDMPPEYADKIPTDKERREFIGAISQLRYLAARDPGPFVIRRLTRVELGNTLHELYGVDAAIANSLPAEVAGAGYLNSISPLQSELLLDIANKVVDQVVAADDKPPTAIQRRLFGDTPGDESKFRSAARNVAQTLARNAYRRPPTEAELNVLVDIFDLGRENKLSYTESLALMLKAVLVSPQFVFIMPAGKIESKDTIVPLDDYQLASRLSYFLWSAPPDAELAKLADEGVLHQPEVLRKQVERMLLNERSRALFDGFGAQWLGVGGLQRQSFDPKVFPQMTDSLRHDMVEETRLFFESVVRENQPVVRFVNSDYTFLNEQLAKLYELEESIQGAQMRRVKLNDPNRGGVLSMSATLATTSFPNRTSPVKRGVWVLEQLLGEQVPPPPPDVPELEKQQPKNVEGLTLRERTELHQTEATCANCHKVFDPIGFGLENFDAIGRWRDKNANGLSIDSKGKLPGGDSFSSPAELKLLLAKKEDALATNFTERLLAYAVGRQLEGYDDIVVDQILAATAKDHYQVRTIITEVVASYLFTHRRVKK